MKFWKKYKAKKELKKKQFVNFYNYQIDLSLGGIQKLTRLKRTIETNDYDGNSLDIIKYGIILTYDNYVEKILMCEGGKEVMIDRIRELESFKNSSKFTELLDQYENLKKEYEQLL